MRAIQVTETEVCPPRASRERARCISVRIALAVMLAATTLVPTATAAGPSCRTSFAGCRTHAQKIRFCRAACVTTRTVCQNAFIKGRLERRCGKRALRACLGERGSCIHACDTEHPCAAEQQCVGGQCIMAQPCTTTCGTGCCGGDYPNCGPDLRCWTKPCDTVCGDTCCGGRYPNCGPDGHCWTRPCETVCGNTCCGGAYPVCDGGTCRAGTPGGDGFPTNLPPGNYEFVICISGTISLPCQSAGPIPFQGVAQLKAAIASALEQWLAATAGTDCSRGATTYSGFNGSEFTATATATCGDATGTVTITVRHL
jgi:hypothetical protein